MEQHLVWLHACMVATFISFLLPKIRNIQIWPVALITTIIYGMIIEMIGPVGIIPLALLAFSTSNLQNQNKYLRWLAYAGTVIFFVLIAAHQFPGFERITIMESAQIKENSSEVYFKTGFDVFCATVILIGLTIKSEKFDLKRVIKNFAIIYPITIATVIPLTILAGYIALEIQFITDNRSVIELFLIYSALQLLITVPMEEMFFRGFIQQRLQDSLTICKSWLPIAIPSLIFGLAHLRGGVILALASTIAGVCYGVIYKRTGRLEASVALHYGLNITHFLFFTYPHLK